MSMCRVDDILVQDFWYLNVSAQNKVQKATKNSSFWLKIYFKVETACFLKVVYFKAVQI